VTVERFIEDLRHEVDLVGVVEKLDQVLVEVIQPRHLSLWVGEPTHRPPS
jgi:hypothetical protein